MSAQLLDVLNPFLTAGIATFVLLYYFVHPKHKLKTEQILIFWFLAGAVFFFVPYIPRAESLPFAFFVVQAFVVFILLANYWKVPSKNVWRFTAIFVLINIASILALSYVFRGVV